MKSDAAGHFRDGIDPRMPAPDDFHPLPPIMEGKDEHHNEPQARPQYFTPKRTQHIRRIKSTRRVVQLRIAYIMKMRLAGAEWYDLIKLVNANSDEPREPLPDGPGAEPWNVSRRTMERYVQLANRWMVKYADRDREATIVRHVAQRRALFNNAVDTGDYRLALSVLDSEAKLLGLYPKNPSAMTDEEIDAAIDAEIAARQRSPYRQLPVGRTATGETTPADAERR